jgi:hypothetical protein
MKPKSSLAAASLAALCLLGQSLARGTTPLPGHQAPGNRAAKNDATPRGLFVSKSADAMRVKVLDSKTGQAVAPIQAFTTNDNLRVVIESNFEGYAYIVNVEIVNSQKRFLLYPNPRTANNRIRPDEHLELSIGFDEKPATEILQVIVSHDKIEYLNAALNGTCSESENRCQLDAQVAARVASIVGDKTSSKQTDTPGIFERQSDRRLNRSGVRSRDIILAPGKDADEKETYVAIPINTVSDGHLKSKQVVVFEVRLKHV